MMVCDVTKRWRNGLYGRVECKSPFINEAGAAFRLRQCLFPVINVIASVTGKHLAAAAAAAAEAAAAVEGVWKQFAWHLYPLTTTSQSL